MERGSIVDAQVELKEFRVPQLSKDMDDIRKVFDRHDPVFQRTKLHDIFDNKAKEYFELLNNRSFRNYPIFKP